jgi:hypothetical protein
MTGKKTGKIAQLEEIYESLHPSERTFVLAKALNMAILALRESEEDLAFMRRAYVALSDAYDELLFLLYGED